MTFNLNTLKNALSRLSSALGSYFNTGSSLLPGITTPTGTTLPPGSQQILPAAGSYGTYINPITQQSVPIGQSSPGYTKWGTPEPPASSDVKRLGAALINTAERVPGAALNIGKAIPFWPTETGAITQPSSPTSVGSSGFTSVNYLTQQSQPAFGGGSAPVAGTFTPPPKTGVDTTKNNITGGNNITSGNNITGGNIQTTAINTFNPSPGVTGLNIPSSGYGSGGVGLSGQNAPQPSNLPPPPVGINVPSQIIGQYEAMLRALQNRNPQAGYVARPLGNIGFGPGLGMGNAIKRIREYQGAYVNPNQS